MALQKEKKTNPDKLICQRRDFSDLKIVTFICHQCPGQAKLLSWQVLHACKQAHLCPRVPAGTYVTGEARFQLPLRTAQLTGAGNQPSLQTPAWARVQCWTQQQRNPIVDKTHRHY